MQLQKIFIGAALVLGVVVSSGTTYGKAYGEVSVDTLNIRAEANTSSRILTQADKNDELHITNELDQWYEVTLQDETKAYVSKDFLKVTKATGEIATSGVRLRTYPSTETEKSDVIETLGEGTNVTIEYIAGEFYKVVTETSQGFVHESLVTPSEYVSEIETKDLKDVKAIELQEQTVTSMASKAKAAPAVATASTLGAAIIEDAKQFLGNPYVYGGNSLTNGIDCSGFTQQIMKRHGVSISRSSRMQYANNGYAVSADALQAGDLVFFGYNGTVSHVGIYIGNGQMIHANDQRTGIIISDVFKSTGKPYIGAKRVI